jgi:hypothetical protein
MTIYRGDLLCEVPFCPALIPGKPSKPFPPGTWWVCPDHWKQTSRLGRKRWAAARRRKKKEVAARIAQRLRCEAIEIALGI